ncbi:MAG TPA: MXAN_5187 C-terminal domain-containing protein [Pyrinomonadaceae bacterium]|jgi:hypothetical protein
MPRENLFVRRLREREHERHRDTPGQEEKKTNLAHEQPLSIDDMLVRLEDDVRKLKVEFDIYFNGSAKRPPYDTKGRVETLIKRLADERNFTYAQRYRYNSIVARYTSFRDLWRRTIQEREEGRGPAAQGARAAHKQEEPHVRRATFVCADARGDVPTVKGLYDALVRAKVQCGEAVDDFSFAQFHRMIAAKTDALKERLGCQSVRYSVYLEDGRVSFKAKAERQRED